MVAVPLPPRVPAGRPYLRGRDRARRRRPHHAPPNNPMGAGAVVRDRAAQAPELARRLRTIRHPQHRPHGRTATHSRSFQRDSARQLRLRSVPSQHWRSAHLIRPPAGKGATIELVAARLLRLRYDGTCSCCETALPKGTKGWWHGDARTTTCASCQPDEALPAAMPLGSDTSARDAPWSNAAGDAGVSSRRVYERRHQLREERIDQRWGRLGGVITFLSDDPQPTTAWVKGSEGERRLAAHLLHTVGDRAVLLHDRKVPGTRDNIDHLAGAASGVWVIDAKNYKGSWSQHASARRSRYRGSPDNGTGNRNQSLSSRTGRSRSLGPALAQPPTALHQDQVSLHTDPINHPARVCWRGEGGDRPAGRRRVPADL